MKLKNLLIIQARMNSSRFPGKVMSKIGQYNCIELIYERLKKSKHTSKIIIATTNKKSDDILCAFLKKKKIPVFRGSENNVLKRFYDLSKLYKPNNIIRVTADCPFVDYKMLDSMLEVFELNKVDYISNSHPPTFPDGLDIEIFTTKSLNYAFNAANSLYDKEHVTPILIKDNKIKKMNFVNDQDLSRFRWTLDDQDDYFVINEIYKKINDKLDFDWKDIYKLKKKYPKIFLKNMKTERNIGAKMSNSQKLWKRALKAIPNGNMFLSKNPNIFLPNYWPTYFTKAKDSYVWDLDNKKYFDFCTMGVGTNILGYNNKVINKAVITNINRGTMSSLNCPEEVYLSEKLLEVNPHFDKVKLARTGGEANSIAVRIARLNTSKQNILLCGYHGWHDWYLAANLSGKKNLDEHLLPGLSPSGVHKNLRNTVKTFQFNNFDDFKNKIESDDKIGIVIMEVARTEEPKNKFLNKIRKYTKEKNIILIFDECTSGFREFYGGLYKKYNVIPDLIVFGKAIGNGYPITAIMGKEELMSNSKKTFLSSTFWSDRVGPTAAIATIDLMNELKSWEILLKMGKSIKKRWKDLFKKYSLKVNIWGLNAIIGFNFEYKDNLKYKTYITQELLKKNILSSNIVYLSTSHSQNDVDYYFYELERVLSKIIQFECGEDIDQFLLTDPASSTFKRIN